MAAASTSITRLIGIVFVGAALGDTVHHSDSLARNFHKGFLQKCRTFAAASNVLACTFTIWLEIMNLIIGGPYVDLSSTLLFVFTSFARMGMVQTIIRRSMIGLTRFHMDIRGWRFRGIEYLVLTLESLGLIMTIAACADAYINNISFLVSRFYTPMYRTIVAVSTLFLAPISSIGDIGLLKRLDELQEELKGNNKSEMAMEYRNSNRVLIYVNLMVGLLEIAFRLSSLGPDYLPLDVFVTVYLVSLQLTISEKFSSIFQQFWESRSGGQSSAGVVHSNVSQTTAAGSKQLVV